MTRKSINQLRSEDNKRLERAGFPHYFDNAGYPRCRNCNHYWYPYKFHYEAGIGIEDMCCKCGAYENAPREQQITR